MVVFGVRECFMVFKLRDLSSVSMVVSLEERAIRAGQIRSLVWEKRVWSGKNELAVHKTCVLHLGCCADRIELALS